MRYMLLMLMLGVPTAHALEMNLVQNAWQLAQSGQNRLSLSEAADLVQRQSEGRVLATQTLAEQGREIYRIKVLTPRGEVRVVHVDAATGRIQ